VMKTRESFQDAVIERRPENMSLKKQRVKGVEKFEKRGSESFCSGLRTEEDLMDG